MAHRIQLIVASALLGACGLGVVGVDPVNQDGGVVLVDGGLVANDGSTTSEGGPPPPADCSDTCSALALTAPGFTPIGFGAESEVCPNGFVSTSAAASDPVAKSGSCACGPWTTTGSTCNTGNIPSSQSNDTSCSGGGAPFPANDGQCKAYSNYWGSTYGGVGVPNPKVGTCRAEGQIVPEKIEVTKSRVCTLQPGTCHAALCSLKGALAACLVAPGDVACPGVAPKKTLIGDLQASCPACTCTPEAKCDGKLHWWEVSTTCSGAESGTVVSNVCTRVNNKNIRSVLWEPTVTESCSAVTPAPQATVTRGGLQTVCCPG